MGLGPTWTSKIPRRMDSKLFVWARGHSFACLGGSGTSQAVPTGPSGEVFAPQCERLDLTLAERRATQHLAKHDRAASTVAREDSNPKAQNSQETLYNMVFGPKILEI